MSDKHHLAVADKTIRKRLLAKYRGRFVLVANGTVYCVVSDEREGHKLGRTAFGAGNYSVQQITE